MAQDGAVEAAAAEVHAVYALLDEHGLAVGAEDRCGPVSGLPVFLVLQLGREQA